MALARCLSIFSYTELCSVENSHSDLTHITMSVGIRAAYIGFVPDAWMTCLVHGNGVLILLLATAIS